MVQMIGAPLDEIGVINAVLDSDNKNYHVWLYRKNLCQHFGLHA